VAQSVMRGEHAWLESGIIDMIDQGEEGSGKREERARGAREEGLSPAAVADD